MNLYLISQTENSDYDTYDAMVVAAPSELTARNINPTTSEAMTEEGWGHTNSSWCSSISQVKAKYLGHAKKGTKPGIILASFNAG